MTDTFATADDLAARLSAGYTAPADPTSMLVKASELVDFATQGRAQLVWDAANTSMKALLTAATCDQVEYWLEVGEEHDVLGLTGSLQGGRVQIQKLPPVLGKRAARTLSRAGLFWPGAAAG